MTDDRILRSLTALMHDVAAGDDSYVDDVLARTERMNQRPAWSFASRWFPASIALARRPLRQSSPILLWIVLAALLIASIVGAAFVGATLMRDEPARVIVIGPTPSAAPTMTARPSQSHKPVPTASPLPLLPMPGARFATPGEYGWTGALGSKTGMHNVIVDPKAPDDSRQTQLVFAVQTACFPRATGARPTPVTVAGLNGLYLEPYDDPDVLFTIDREVGATTGAYALSIGDRTLCVYVTWDAATTPDELSAVRQVVESLRGQPFGQDGIRIVFTLPAGWDTG